MDKTHGVLPASEWFWVLFKERISFLSELLIYALPLAAVPAAALGFASIQYGGALLPQLAFLSTMELVMTVFVFAIAVPLLGALTLWAISHSLQIPLRFDDTYRWTLLSSAPIWLAQLGLLWGPSWVWAVLVALALVFSGTLAFWNAQAALWLEDKNKATVMAAFGVTVEAFGVILFVFTLAMSMKFLS